MTTAWGLVALLGTITWETHRSLIEYQAMASDLPGAIVRFEEVVESDGRILSQLSLETGMQGGKQYYRLFRAGSNSPAWEVGIDQGVLQSARYGVEGLPPRVVRSREPNPLQEQWTPFHAIGLVVANRTQGNLAELIAARPVSGGEGSVARFGLRVENEIAGEQSLQFELDPAHGYLPSLITQNSATKPGAKFEWGIELKVEEFGRAAAPNGQNLWYPAQYVIRFKAGPTMRHKVLEWRWVADLPQDKLRPGMVAGASFSDLTGDREVHDILGGVQALPSAATVEAAISKQSAEDAERRKEGLSSSDRARMERGGHEALPRKSMWHVWLAAASVVAIAAGFLLWKRMAR